MDRVCKSCVSSVKVWVNPNTILLAAAFVPSWSRGGVRVEFEVHARATFLATASPSAAL